MARLFHTGAESGSQRELLTSAGTNIITSVHHTGTGSNYSYILPGFSLPANSERATSFPALLNGKATMYYKADIRVGDIDSSDNVYLQPFRLSSNGIYIANLHIYNSSGTMRVSAEANASTNIRGSGTSIGDVATGVSWGTWFRLEVMFDSTPADGSESYKVRINGNEVISSSSLTFAYKSASAVDMAIVNNTASLDPYGTFYIDNISFNDASGSYNNTWVGEEYITCVVPSAAGSANPSSGTYASINEIPMSTTMSSSANMVSVNTSSNAPWFKLGSGGLNNINHQINAISVPVLANINSGSNTTYNIGIKSAASGREYYANKLYYPDLAYIYIGGFTIGGTTQYMSPSSSVNYAGLLVSETDPVTNGPWKPTGTNSLASAQIGIRSGGTYNVQVGWMTAMVAYTPKEANATYGMLAMF